jgi:hypothetical protein
MKKTPLVLALTMALASSASAADFATDFAKAKTLFAQRGQSLASVQEAAALLDSIVGAAPNATAKFEAQILASRAYYWVGGHIAGKDQKLAAYLAGKKRADDARATNSECAEGYYFAAINLGKWGLTNGIFDSLKESGNLEALAKETKEYDTCLGDSAGSPGETIDGYGPDRTLGKMYFKLPPVNPYGPTGSRTQALFALERAVKNANTPATRVALNTVYLAEVLKAGNGAEKARGKQLLQELISTVERDASAYNPNRVPESLDEIAEAKELLKDF